MQNYIVTLSQLFFLSTITYYYFGEMEQNSLPRGCFARWSKKWQPCLRKTTFLKNGHQKNTPPETTLFAPFLPNFITFYISQHYGRHVTTSLLRHPEHKGNPAELGGRTPKK
jgi:hypothetical protein